MTLCNCCISSFQSVFKPVNNPTTFPECPVFSDSVMNNVTVSTDQVYSVLKNIDSSSASGFDNLPGTILSKCASELCIPLTIIFNISLSRGEYPSLFKRANVVPVFKSGDRCHANNYRPISLLPLFSKVFEKVVLTSIQSHVYSAISNHQHGFIPGRSTATNLILYTDFISKEINSGRQVDAVYLDFSKVFDSVDHSLLNFKLNSYGLCGNLNSWFRSYLTDRLQRVVISGHKSAWGKVTSGVPQGSILGPIMIIMYINDFTRCVKNSEMSLYADDSKIFKSIDTKSDCKSLQADVDNITTWCREWKLDLNMDKCSTITFTNKNFFILYKYYINRTFLSRVNTIKDLGVILSSNVNYNTHTLI